jgi:hypothetical protein
MCAAAPGAGHHGGRRATAAAMVGVCFISSSHLANRVSGVRPLKNHTNGYKVRTYETEELVDDRKKRKKCPINSS